MGKTKSSYRDKDGAIKKGFSGWVKRGYKYLHLKAYKHAKRTS